MNSTLALKKADYESELGDYMGFGRGEDQGDIAWDDRKERLIRMDVASGLRRFYYCGHPWSFLKPIAALSLVSGASTVTLPDDFGGIDGGVRVVVLNSSSAVLASMPFVGPGGVQHALDSNPGSGAPMLVAIRPIKAMAPGKMQRSELVVFPEADQDYTLKFSYFITPDYLLDVTQPFAYGGVEHHETILEMCLSVAEARRDNSLTVHAMESQRLLQLSIRMDQRKQPTKLGYNGDRSDGGEMDFLNGRGWTTGGGVTINGTLYD